MAEPDSRSVCAILAAAGIGSRLAEKLDLKAKQFFQLAGRPIYQWSLLQLCKHPEIRYTVVVTLEEMVSTIDSEVAALGLADRVMVTAGGVTRQQSVRLGLSALSMLSPAPELVLVHDAARPFVSETIIDLSISAARKHGASTTAVPASDTIKKVEGELVAGTLDRKSLVLVQTPQVSRLDWLVSAHEKGVSLSVAATDDASLLESAGYPVAVVPGSKLNLKITEPDDLVLAEAIAAIVRKG